MGLVMYSRPASASNRQRTENADLVLLAKHRKFFKIWGYRFRQAAAIVNRCNHLEHHSYKSDLTAGNCVNKNLRVLVTAASKSMGYAAWKENVTSGPGYDFLPSTDDLKFSIQ